MDPDRKRRQDEAYKLQRAGAIEGAVRWTIYGLITCTVLNFRWPWFRKQTLAGKGFIVSSCTMFGLVTWADHYLISYENDERQQNEQLRRAAQQSLANSGRIGSEANIRDWLRENRERKLEEFQAGYVQKQQKTSKGLIPGLNGSDVSSDSNETT